MIECIDHVNIVVDDMANMVDFYARVLGMEVFKEVTISGKWVDDVVGLQDVLADVTFLRPPVFPNTPPGTNLELIRYRSPIGTRPDALSKSNTAGIRHLAFRVTRIDEVVARCQKAGVSFNSTVQDVPTAQMAPSATTRKRLIYFHDPEGNLLEFCSYDETA